MLKQEPYCIVTNKTDESFFTLKEAKINSEQDKQVLFSGKVVECEEIPLPGTRKKVNALAYKFPIMDENNRVSGVAGVFIESPLKHETVIETDKPVIATIGITPQNQPDVFKYY